MFWQKKWGNFRKIGSKSLEKYGLEKPRGYEIVTEDLFATIDYNKRVRLEHAKENISFEQAETQRMEA